MATAKKTPDNGLVRAQEMLPNSRVKLTIALTYGDFKPAFEAELDQLSQATKVQGFRPGKAPRAKALAAIGHERVESGALDRAINATYFMAMRQVDMVPVSAPMVEITSYVAPTEGSADDVLVAEYTLQVDVVPQIAIEKSYKKISVKPAKPKAITAKDVDEMIEYLRKQRAGLSETKDGAKAAKGMWADISFDGAVGGVHREDMKSAHHALIVGDNTLIPGFEENIIGMSPAESKTFDITFPDDYGVESLRKEVATFTIVLNELKEIVMPTVDPEFAKNFGHDTVEALEAAIKESLEQERELEAQRATEELVVDELLKLADFDLPESMVEQEQKRLTEETYKRLGLADQSRPLPDAVLADLPVQAKRNVRIGFVISKIAELEGVAEQEGAMRLALDKAIAYATGVEK
jgi:trigger factor